MSHRFVFPMLAFMIVFCILFMSFWIVVVFPQLQQSLLPDTPAAIAFSAVGQFDCGKLGNTPVYVFVKAKVAAGTRYLVSDPATGTAQWTQPTDVFGRQSCEEVGLSNPNLNFTAPIVNQVQTGGIQTNTSLDPKTILLALLGLGIMYLGIALLRRS